GSSTVSDGDPQPYRKSKSNPQDDPRYVSGRRATRIHVGAAPGWTFHQHCHGKRRNTLRGSLVVSPPTARTDAHDLMEGASERRLIREACLFRNVGQRLARVDQELLGTLNPALHEPSVR